MGTKYDWSIIPLDVNFISTDANGRKYGYSTKPIALVFANCWHAYDSSRPLGFMGKDLDGCHEWESSLEQRPVEKN